MGRIISWWHKEHPRAINIDMEDNVPWLTANWVEKRQATPKEREIYEKGGSVIFIKDTGTEVFHNGQFIKISEFFN